MTQEELLKKLEEIDRGFMIVPSEEHYKQHPDLRHWRDIKAEKRLQVINQHVAEVIGEDYDETETESGSDYFAKAVNQEKAEQRKRAGLDK